MQTIEAQMVVNDIRWARGQETEARAEIWPVGRAIGEAGTSVEGSITIRGLDLKPGQRIKAEFHILDAEDRSVREGDTASMSHV